MEVGQTDQTGPVKKVICWRNWRQMSFKSQNAVVASDKYIDETFDEYSDVTSDKYIDETLNKYSDVTFDKYGDWLLINTVIDFW